MTIGSILVVCIMFLCIGAVACLKLFVDLSDPRKVTPI
tara:strand:+ start:379 stop:492 length:114 start_codon:yes stop_codon:yes gene_type:complete